MGQAKRLREYVARGGEDWGLHGVRGGSVWWRWRLGFKELTPAGAFLLGAFEILARSIRGRRHK